MKNNPWIDRRIVAWAHQGGAFEGPSSTLFAIGQAVERGATAVELDVHATKDRQIVVCHDETVDRTTNHSGAISNFTLSELRDMDNSYWWIEGDATSPGRPDDSYLLRGRAPHDHRFGIATLEEVLTTWPGVVFNMDIKQTDPDVEPYEQLLANELRRLNREQTVIVASFHDSAIQKFRSIAPEIPTSCATQETAAFYFSVAANEEPAPLPGVALQVPADFEGIEVVTPAFIEAAHRQGVAVHVWTINERTEMERLVDLGVDGIITDTPTLLVALLNERGLAWDGAL